MAPEAAAKIVQTLDDVQALDGHRIDTGIAGLNRVLGTNRTDARRGLAIPSSVIFSGGEGSGKSTLLLEMLARTPEKKTLFITAEQTLAEMKSMLMGIGLSDRASRISAYSLLDDRCSMIKAFEIIKALDPRILIIDSVSKIRENSIQTKQSSPSKVRVVEAFKQDAESNRRAVILVAHVTKADRISGANETLHDVSTLLKLTKLDGNVRLLQCAGKNRFGDTSEQAYFRMQRTGLKEIISPSEIDAIETALRDSRGSLKLPQ